jgi:dTDP-4-amino-4,6-dideoxygalactose transaminase/nucleoside-diphosphate-sugar epimerase
MQVLVTGGGGYLGCCVVPHLIERGHQVRVFDRFCFGEESLRSVVPDEACDIVRGDVRGLDAAPGLLDDIEGIIHLAGLSNDPSCDLDPEMAEDVNVTSTRRLVEMALDAGVRRFVLASSCSVYGQGVIDVLDEQSPPNPVTNYAVGKLACEEMLREVKGGGFEYVIGRPATLFGWSPCMRFDLAINQMTATAAREACIHVYGGGNQWRPFLHVRDAARAFTQMLEAPAEKADGEVFNVGFSDVNYRIIDLAKKVAEEFEGIELDVAKDDDDIRNYNVSFDKIRDVLELSCEWSVERGVREIREALSDESIEPFADIYFRVRRMKELLSIPASEGGEPVAPRLVALAPPSIDEREERAVVDVLRSGWLTTGAKVSAFEEAFAESVGAEHAVAVSSCTAALHLCLVDAGVGPGDEVILSPITWASTANTIVRMDASPIFADVDPRTLNIDPAAIEAAVTGNTKAIMPVHLAGQPCDLQAINGMAEKHGLAVIEDAAHALGAQYRGAPIGGGTNPACFSFYPVKNITTIEGGAITLAEGDKADRLRKLAHNGMEQLSWDRYSPDAAAAPVQVVEPGFKYNMPNVNAALGLVQLEKLPDFLASRRRLMRLYRSVLADVDEIALLDSVPETEHACHLLIVRLKLDELSKSRDEIAQMLRHENVQTGIHFFGVHLHPYYRDALGIQPDALPHATAASHEILSLPLHPDLSDRNLGAVVDALKKVLRHARK